MSLSQPSGEERRVQFLGGASVDGAPVAYLIVLAAVVTVLAFIPFSAVLGMGGSFPMSQGVYSLVGWILGPLAGAVSSGIGTLIGVFVAPHTTRVWYVSVMSALITSFAAGAMAAGGKRRGWWLLPFVLGVLGFVVYVGRGLQNGVALSTALMTTFVNWSALILYLLPTRTLFARWIASTSLLKLATGLFLGTWMTYGLAHVCAGAITYLMFNWPAEVWMTLIPIIPVEFATRGAIGAVIGTGVIAGLRAIGLVKPTHAAY